MLSEDHLDEVDRLITETPVAKKDEQNAWDSMLPDIEVDDASFSVPGAKTVAAIAPSESWPEVIGE